eukprot:ANDGO_00164.mRNA.1 E3 ubiquitin-protein ligase Bre1
MHRKREILSADTDVAENGSSDLIPALKMSRSASQSFATSDSLLSPASQVPGSAAIPVANPIASTGVASVPGPAPFSQSPLTSSSFPPSSLSSSSFVSPSIPPAPSMSSSTSGSFSAVSSNAISSSIPPAPSSQSKSVSISPMHASHSESDLGLSGKALFHLDQAKEKQRELETRVAQLESILVLREEQHSKNEEEIARWRSKYFQLQQESIKENNSLGVLPDAASIGFGASSRDEAVDSDLVFSMVKAGKDKNDAVILVEHRKLFNETQVYKQDSSSRISLLESEISDVRSQIGTVIDGSSTREKAMISRLNAVESERDSVQRELEALRVEAESDPFAKRGKECRAFLQSMKEQLDKAVTEAGRYKQKLDDIMQARSSLPENEALMKELELERESSSILAMDMESVLKAYEDSQALNLRLASQVSELDDGHRQLVTERLKWRKSQEELQQLRNLESEKADRAFVLVRKLEEAQFEYERTIAILKDTISKLEDELLKTDAEASAQRRSAAFAYATMEQERGRLAAERDRVLQGKEVLDDLEAQLRDANSTVRNKSEQLAAMTVQLQELTKELNLLRKKTDGASGDRSTLMYRKLAICSQCNDRPKDSVIAKCFHAFCRKCINQNLANRNRKCPACQTVYDQKDVKSLFL